MTTQETQIKNQTQLSLAFNFLKNGNTFTMFKKDGLIAVFEPLKNTQVLFWASTDSSDIFEDIQNRGGYFDLYKSFDALTSKEEFKKSEISKK